MKYNTEKLGHAPKLCFLVCQNYRYEVEKSIIEQGWEDVSFLVVRACCGRNTMSWQKIKEILPSGVTKVVAIGRDGFNELEEPPLDFPQISRLSLELCFSLVAGNTFVSDLMESRSYLITPGWLEHWQSKIEELGFPLESAGKYFKEFANDLVLLDTGIFPDSILKLKELSIALELPFRRIRVGLDYTKLLLNLEVHQWRYNEKNLENIAKEKKHTRAIADFELIIDQLTRLSNFASERVIMEHVESLFKMLFSPTNFYYIKIMNGNMDESQKLPIDLLAAVQELKSSYAWTPSEDGFILKIKRDQELLGIIILNGFNFPIYREEYLNLALSMISVIALVIKEERTRSEVEAERRKAKLILEESEAKLRAILDSALDGVITLDYRGLVIDINPMAELIFGWRKDEILNTPFLDILNPGELKSGFQKDMEEYFQTSQSTVLNQRAEIFAVRRNGSIFPLEIAIIAIRKKDKNFFTAFVRDISQRKQMEDEIKQLAFYDTLTELPNRRLFLNRLHQAKIVSKRKGSHIAVIFMDLDNFKSANDTYGHEAGDSILIEASQRLRSCLRESDNIARFGGDEFVVLITELSSDLESAIPQARMVAKKIQNKLSIAYLIHILDENGTYRSVQHFCPGSIGVSLCLADDISTVELLRLADSAMYQAKQKGGNQIQFA